MRLLDIRRPLAALAAACLLCGQAGAVPGGEARETREAVQTAYEAQEAAALTGDLFLDYLEHLAGVDGEAVLLSRAGDSLTGINRQLYDRCHEEAAKLAAGGRSGADPLSTRFSITLNDSIKSGEDINTATDRVISQIDSSLVTDALFMDFPYEFYWHGLSAYGYCTSESFSSSLTITYTLNIAVAEAFRSEVQGNEEDYQFYHLRSGLAELADSVVKRAKSIVAENAGKSDYGKLTAYRDIICDLADYNDDAADDSKNIAYGNPWQIIWVFDDDPSTKVVCEAYSKAFKFLCDLSQFSDPAFDCVLVSGVMDMGQSHMWNHVLLNGKAYLADVTNSDSGCVGENGELFLKAPVKGYNRVDAYLEVPDGNLEKKNELDPNHKYYLFNGYGGNTTRYDVISTRADKNGDRLIPTEYTLYPASYLTLAEEDCQPGEEAQSPVVSAKADGGFVRVTVTASQYSGQTVWAAAFDGGGRMVDAGDKAVDSVGKAAVSLNAGTNNQIRVFVLDPETLRPLEMVYSGKPS